MAWLMIRSNSLPLIRSSSVSVAFAAVIGTRPFDALYPESG
jgi:hypothetical protein